jgi:predicted ATP-dependent endonuclease of OLD family
VEFDVTIRNFRSFQKPATIRMRRGPTNLLGINNSGKSSLLRFFYEFRSIFAQFLNGFETNSLSHQLKGQESSFNPPGNIFDYEELFCDRNSRDLEIESELQEVTRISQRVFALIDSERDDPGKPHVVPVGDEFNSRWQRHRDRSMK